MKTETRESKTTGKPRHYQLKKVLSYYPDTVLIIGERNLGKTFTVREQLFLWWLEKGERFCILARHENRIPELVEGYFSKVFERTENKKLRRYVEENKPETKLEKGVLKLITKDKNDKVLKQTIGYAVDIAVKQHAKDRTFHNARNFIFDEAIIEPEDLRYSRYIPDEFANLYSVVNSVTREDVDNPEKPRVFLLGNAADLINPWFRECDINEVPSYGLHWYLRKTFLIDYVNPDDYDTGNREDNTLAGRALAHRQQGRMSEHNEFTVNDDFVCVRPKGASYECGFIYRGEVFAVWVDYADGLTYITSRFVKGVGAPMYALTTKDNRVNYLAANQSKRAMRELIERYSLGLMRFESIAKRERFTRMMRDFGIR